MKTENLDYNVELLYEDVDTFTIEQEYCIEELLAIAREFTIAITTA